MLAVKVTRVMGAVRRGVSEAGAKYNDGPRERGPAEVMRRLVVLILLGAIGLAIALLLRGANDEAPATVMPADGGDTNLPTLTLPAAPTRNLAPLATGPAPADVSVFQAFVRHADGAPARGAIAVLARGEAVVWRAFTDVEGRLRGEASDGAATLWVGGATLDPVPFELTAARGSQEFTLPTGEVIDGQVTVDGGPPPESFFLQIDGGPRSSQPEPPESVFNATQPWRIGVSTDIVTQGQLVGTDGGFHFSGLPAGWSGAFVPEYGWYLEDDKNQDVSAPARGVLLPLRRTSRLRLRVLAAGTREPAAGAQVLASLHADQAINEHIIVCDDDGRAEMPLIRWESAHSVSLDLADAAGTEHRVLVVPIPDASHDIDLGDIELQRSRNIAFHVRSSAGEPVAGAVAFLEGERTEVSRPTGSAGLGHLDNVAPEFTRMRVVADRFEPVSVELPPQSPPDPIEVTLPGCASIEVRIASSDGTVRDGLSLFWIAPRTSSADDAGSEVYRQGLMRGSGLSSTDHAPTEFHLQSHPDGTSSCDAYATMPARTGGPFRLGCLAADEPIDVYLLDRTGFALWSQPGIRLAPGETRELQALIATAPWTANVLVTDPAGVPLAGAGVDIFNSEGAVSPFAYPWRSEHTKSDGRVEIAPIYAPSVTLHAGLEGWSPAKVEGVVPGVATNVVLSRGVNVRLTVVDSTGRPVAIESPWVRDAHGRRVDAEEAGADEPDETMFLANDVHAVWQLSTLPSDSDLVVIVRAGGKELSFPLDTRKPETRITLPASGSVTVKQPEAARALVKLSVELTGADDDSRRLTEDLRTDGEKLRDIELPLVLPGAYRVVLRGEEPVSHAIVKFEGSVTVEVGKNAVVAPR
jgi:hypothetical protein